MYVLPIYTIRRNIPSNATDEYLSTCRYNSVDARDKFCPIFYIHSVTEGAGHSFKSMAAEVELSTMFSCFTFNGI